VPRRETFTAKKLDEVHAEAEAELGMVTVARIADLPALPVQVRVVFCWPSLGAAVCGSGHGHGSGHACRRPAR
jgi:hypothetical protein